MAGAVMDSIVILDDDDEEASTSASTSYSHATNCSQRHLEESAAASNTHLPVSVRLCEEGCACPAGGESKTVCRGMFLNNISVADILTTHYKYS